MASYLNAYIDRLRQKLSDPPNVEAATHEAIVQEAVRIYSRHRPQIKVEDITGTGSFNVDLPDGFIDDFSHVVAVEYPYDSGDQIPAYIKDTDYLPYRTPTGFVLRMLTSTPATSEVVRLTYTLPHSLDNSSTTIPIQHEDAVMNLAAALVAEMLAAEYTEELRSPIGDITVDFQAKAEQYRLLAERYYRLFRIGISLHESGVDPCTDWTDLDFRFGFREGYLTHPKAWR